MSEKNLDAQGRLRSKTVAFRMSPGEADLLQRMADMSGMTKQDYIISRVTDRTVTVVPNKRMQLYLEENLLYAYKELRRLETGVAVPEDLMALLEAMTAILVGLGADGKSLEPSISDDDAIVGMER